MTFINIINTLLAVLPHKEKIKEYKEVCIAKDFYIKQYRDIKKCSKLLIVNHGMGGGKDSAIVISLINRFKNNDDICIIAYDAPGIDKNINTDYFWGAHIDGQGLYYDEVIDYIRKENKNIKIYISAFSASASALLTYLSCSQGIVKNNNLKEISHSFLISPPSNDYSSTLDWISKNSKLAKYIAFSQSYKAIKYYLRKRKYKKAFKIVRWGMTDIKRSSRLTGKNKFYKHSVNKPLIINATVILSTKDPITKWFKEDNNTISVHSYQKIYKINGGGHCGFYKLNGKRSHEEIIYNYILSELPSPKGEGFSQTR